MQIKKWILKTKEVPLKIIIQWMVMDDRGRWKW